MKKLLTLLLLAGLSSCGSWGSYIATGVNEYGTRYVVTQDNDTIYREDNSRVGGYPTFIPTYNPYWNNNVFGPRIVIFRTPVSNTVRSTTNVATPRGSRGGATPNTTPRVRVQQDNITDVSGFCDGWYDGYEQALDDNFRVGLAPLCPLEPISSDGYKTGFGLGYSRALKDIGK